MTTTTPIEVIHLTHPEHETPAVATVVKNWIEAGRYAGYELQFEGEPHTRHLRFKEIRKLQNKEI
jgi:hypothetical protein